MGTLKIFSLSNFPTSSIVLTLVTMVYILLWRHLFQNWRFVVYDPLHPYCYLHPCNPYSIFCIYELRFLLVCFQNPQFSRHRGSSLNKAWSHKPSLFHLSEETSPQTNDNWALERGASRERSILLSPHPSFSGNPSVGRMLVLLTSIFPASSCLSPWSWVTTEGVCSPAHLGPILRAHFKLNNSAGMRK